MKYLHTMVRVTDIDASLRFYCEALGLKELARTDYPKGRFTLVFLAAPGDESAQVELTHNWDPEPYGVGRNFGHLAYEVEDIYASCRAPAGARRDHPAATARRPHGVRALARQRLHRAAAEGRGARAGRTLALDAQHRQLVGAGPAPRVPP